MADKTSQPGAPQGAEGIARSHFGASSGLLAELIDLAEDAIISIDTSQHIILFNQGAERVFGYKSKDVIGKPLDILLPHRMSDQHRKQVSDFMESPESARPMRERQMIRGLRKDGTEFPAEASISKVDSDGATLLTVILRDVTDRVAADQKLQESLREKEALLREIHHRVKNNLQVMSSLLGLQSRAVAQEETRRAFEDSQDRIHSMALLHEMLCQSGNLARIDLAEYTRQLVGHLFRAYGVDSERIRLSMHLDPVYLDQEGAVPFGLIVNELATNALRHAFAEGGKGEIQVTLQQQPDQHVELIVRDNGVGLSKEADWRKDGSLGFRLVRMLAEQLGAKLEVKPRDPTEFHLVFDRR